SRSSSSQQQAQLPARPRPPEIFHRNGRSTSIDTSSGPELWPKVRLESWTLGRRVQLRLESGRRSFRGTLCAPRTFVLSARWHQDEGSAPAEGKWPPSGRIL